MKYTETGFRAVYHHFAVFPLTDATRSAIKDFPGEKTADGVLTYGYYDREAGMTLEVLGCARKHGEFWQFADSNNLIRSFIRADTVADEDFCLFMDEDGTLAGRYAEKLAIRDGEGFAAFCRDLARLDTDNRDRLFNIGFCAVG